MPTPTMTAEVTTQAIAARGTTRRANPVAATRSTVRNLVGQVWTVLQVINRTGPGRDPEREQRSQDAIYASERDHDAFAAEYIWFGR